MTLEEALDRIAELEHQIQEEKPTRQIDLKFATKEALTTFREDFGLPDHKLMAYQKEMICKAIEHILTYDTLKGLGEK